MAEAPSLAVRLRGLPRRKRKRVPRLPKPPTFNNVEARYGAGLADVVQGAVWPRLEAAVLPNVEAWSKNVQWAAGTTRTRDAMDAVRTDQYERIMEAFGNIKVAILEQETALAAQARREAERAAQSVDDTNRKWVRTILKRVLGVDVFQAEPWLEDMAGDWVTQNVSLVRNLTSEALNDMEQIVYRMVRGGASREDTRKALEERFTMSRRRARLIARDQVNKFNADLNRQRQGQLGITEYFWQNMQDQRVRGNPGGRYPNAEHNHWRMQGIVCRWDNPTVYSRPEWARKRNGERTWKRRPQWMPHAHPGEEIQCRCIPIPNMQPLLEAVQ